MIDNPLFTQYVFQMFINIGFRHTVNALYVLLIIIFYTE